MLACANFLNSRIVMRFGTRRISQTAVLVLIVDVGDSRWWSRRPGTKRS